MIYRPELAELILDNVAILVTGMDSGEILWVNAAAEALFGNTIRGAMVGMSVDDLVPDESRDAHAEYRKEFAQSPSTRAMGARLQLNGRRIDGTVFPVRVSLIPSMLSGRKCVVALVFDMTDPAEGH